MSQTKSRYTLKACPVARMPFPNSLCYFASTDRSFGTLVFYVWIVCGGGKVGLIDTGLPPQPGEVERLNQFSRNLDPRCVYSDLVPLQELLKRERIRPDQIDFVALTQPSTYCTGGLLPEAFPRAEVFLSRAGVMEFLLENVGHPPRWAYFTEASWVFLRRLLIEDRLRLVDEETEIRPGIFFESTGGHHPGSAGVRVPTKQGVIGILDTAFYQRNVDEELPVGVAEDVAACRRVIKRYKRLCDFVAADHDPLLAKRFRG